MKERIEKKTNKNDEGETPTTKGERGRAHREVRNPSESPSPLKRKPNALEHRTARLFAGRVTTLRDRKNSPARATPRNRKQNRDSTRRELLESPVHSDDRTAQSVTRWYLPKTIVSRGVTASHFLETPLGSGERKQSTYSRSVPRVRASAF